MVFSMLIVHEMKWCLGGFHAKRQLSTSICHNMVTTVTDAKRITEHKIQKPIRRALLYVPGFDKKKISKIPTLNVDCAVLDCEDGVGIDRKEEARSTILDLYDQIASESSREVCVRINPPSSYLCKVDIEVLFDVEKPPQALVVPKINHYEELQWVCNKLQEVIGTRYNLCNSIGIIFMTESGQGLINLKKIIECGISTCSKRHSCCRIDGVIFGSDDFCADLGISRTPDATELLYARQKIVSTTKAFSLQAIDMVHIDYQDLQGLEKQAREGFGMGFTGKQVIHPGQVPVVQRCFVPSQDRMEWAFGLLKEYQACTEGVFTYRGQMIDMPTILQAQNIAKLHELIEEQTDQ